MWPHQTVHCTTPLLHTPPPLWKFPKLLLRSHSIIQSCCATIGELGGLTKVWHLVCNNLLQGGGSGNKIWEHYIKKTPNQFKVHTKAHHHISNLLTETTFLHVCQGLCASTLRIRQLIVAGLACRLPSCVVLTKKPTKWWSACWVALLTLSTPPKTWQNFLLRKRHRTIHWSCIVRFVNEVRPDFQS